MLSSIKVIGTGFILTTLILSSASAADMVENYNPPRQVRTAHHVHYTAERFRHVAYEREDCGQLYYEYRTTPPYTEIKTMCGPKPIVYDTGFIRGRAPN
jgi:hypothetical protein